jgi:light-regulated signal transduction histidine kinase (bacteriophytochrome)
MPQPIQIQSYAQLITLDLADYRIQSCSENLEEIVGADAGVLLNEPITKLFPEAFIERLRSDHHLRVPFPHVPPPESHQSWRGKQVIPFFTDRQLVCEIEPTAIDRRQFSREVALKEVTTALNDTHSLSELLETACEKFSRYLRTDRTVVYRLFPNGGGVIESECRTGKLPSLAGLHFRRDDFSEEAHRLFQDESVLGGTISFRGGSTVIGEPVEAENLIRYRLGSRMPYRAFTDFIQESEVNSIISVALRVDGQLWGVMFGHCIEPVRFDYQMRTFVHLFGTLISQEITSHTRTDVRQRILKSNVVHSQLKERVAGALDLIDGLTGGKPTLLDAISRAGGAVIHIDGRSVCLGDCPPEEELRRLLYWAASSGEQDEILVTNNLESRYPHGQTIRASAAGCLLVPLNARRTDWLGWFRPELVEEIAFGSLPPTERKVDGLRFLPSTETKRGFARPWKQGQVQLARDLQVFIRDVIMERYSQLRRMNQQLEMAYEEMADFSYMVSHDLRAPLRGIDGYAEILLEDYGGGIDPDGRELIQIIQRNAARMNEFIADILELSRISRANLIINRLSVPDLVAEALAELSTQLETTPKVTIQDNLPNILGDQRQLLTVYRHLLSNAIKYSSRQPEQQIEVGFRTDDSVPTGGEFFVADNGIGVNRDHHQRIFGMFNRLVTRDQYAGNGVGLAIARRIIQNHNGRIRVESKQGEGASFLFYTHPTEK